MNLFEELKWRGMVKDCSSTELAEKHLVPGTKFYIGFDPTGSSLTCGHLVQIVRIKLLEERGLIPICLIGGTTGAIGDPKPNGERHILSNDLVKKNVGAIEKQVKKILKSDKVIFVNNSTWLSKLSIIEFLRDFGKNFGINYMLEKDVIKRRLETGISYTEFSYLLLQSIDFYHLYKNYGCKIQFGGSEQWGNITAGLELIRKLEGDNDALGLSSPLLLKADGTKFGKSESGALWLDENLTSPYTLYQYFLNVDDKMIVEYLKLLTLLSVKEIEELEKSVLKEPEKRLAQTRLAEFVCEFVHGKTALESAKKITDALFKGSILELGEDEFKMLYSAFGKQKFTSESKLTDILVSLSLAKSKREAREFMQAGSIYINGEKITNVEQILTDLKPAFEKYFIVKRGKKQFSAFAI